MHFDPRSIRCRCIHTRPGSARPTPPCAANHHQPAPRRCSPKGFCGEFGRRPLRSRRHFRRVATVVFPVEPRGLLQSSVDQQRQEGAEQSLPSTRTHSITPLSHQHQHSLPITNKHYSCLAQGLEFISTVEGINYPIYATQWVTSFSQTK